MVKILFYINKFPVAKKDSFTEYEAWISLRCKAYLDENKNKHEIEIVSLFLC